MIAIILGLIDLIVLMSQRKYKEDEHNKIVILENPSPPVDDGEVVND